ncbi:MAG: AraC family transcriptional regulator [Acetatifactor sp.]|nr:AraC family transcriptional regulator [Acetatifactor sp.]
MNNFGKISEAIKYIDAHLNDTLSVRVIAEQFAFSPYYFHRLFTSIVGKSMIAYIRDRRIAYACKMLNETDRKVLDIALDLGFDSAQGFSRTFRSITGMSPTEYRSRKITPCIVPAAELVKRFTNRLKGGILMNPDMIKKEKMILAGVSGFGNETAEIWKHFMKLYKEAPPAGKISDDSYEVRIYDSAAEKESVFIGCEIKSDCNSGCSGYEIFQIPSSAYASFDVYVKEGYDSENRAMEEWLVSNEKEYVRNLLEGKPYCIEHYDARFDDSNDESIVEIWLPVKKIKQSLAQ